jgi:spore germination cell wall hydrolase CwlJ-like protein
MMVKYILLFVFLVTMMPITPAISADNETYQQDPSDTHCLAKAIYFEASRNNTKMQEAVAAVIINRVEDDRYPDTICEVIHQRTKNSCQFSWYCTPQKHIDPQSWANALSVARRSIENWVAEKSYDITHGATHFHDTRVHPSWGHYLTKTLTINNMVFYK